MAQKDANGSIDVGAFGMGPAYPYGAPGKIPGVEVMGIRVRPARKTMPFTATSMAAIKRSGIQRLVRSFDPTGLFDSAF